MKHNLFGLILSLAAVLAAASCSNDYLLDEDVTPAGASDKICFVATTNGSASRSGSDASRCVDGAYIRNFDRTDSLYLNVAVTSQDAAALSRGAELTAEADYNPLRVTCRKRVENNRYEYYFSNIPFSKNASGVWVSSPEYYWLDEDSNFSFYAYAPDSPNGATYIADEETLQPKLQFEVPADVTLQPDIVYNSIPGEYIATAKQTVPLKLEHALANITFKTGNGMAAGTIRKVTVKNVNGRGTFNLTNGQWTIDPQFVTSFSADVDKPSADNLEITTNPDKTKFMLLPGSNSEATVFEFEFQKQDGTTATYSTAPGMLATPWEAGLRYIYTLTISPDFEIELADPEIQDAHYVICKARISKADNMRPDQKWELTATADDGADVTLLPESQVNDYQKRGFWLDRKMFKAHNSDIFVDRGSARGERTLTGVGTGELIYVFLPENAARPSRTRTVTLSLKVNGASKVLAVKTIRQLSPAWVEGSDFGWEQLENDPEAQWGFLWDRKVVYRKRTALGSLVIYTPLVRDLIEQYNADDYAKVENPFVPSMGWLVTTVSIDYSKLNNLSTWGLNDYDGCGNTRILYGKSGGATTGNLEQAIKDLVSRGAHGVFDIIEESGTNSMTSAALGYIMRKNKFNLNIIEKKDGADIATSESPAINAESIVWFLPAKEQLNRPPTEGSTFEGTYWSSTPGETNQAFTSAGPANRLQSHKIRACRHMLQFYE